MATKGKDALRELLAAKRAGSPFIHLDYSRQVLWRLERRQFVFASRGLDGTRYTITLLGEKFINAKPPLVYTWNKNQYATLEDMALGENMTFNQARYRVRRGYTCNADMVNNQPVIVNNKLFANAKEAAKALHRTPKDIRKSVSRARRKQLNPKQYNDYALNRKRKAFEAILKGERNE